MPTILITRADVERLTTLLRLEAPVDTGNLHDNGIPMFTQESAGLWRCTIGGPIAPYAPYIHVKGDQATLNDWIYRAISRWSAERKISWQNKLKQGGSML